MTSATLDRSAGKAMKKGRIGVRQLARIRALGTTYALIVPDALSRRLVELGLQAARPDGAMSHNTTEGLRALADAVDAGRITLFDPDSDISHPSTRPILTIKHP